MSSGSFMREGVVLLYNERTLHRMKTNLTIAGLVVAVFGAAALFAFSGGIIAMIILAAGLVMAAAGAYQESKARDEVRTAAVQYIQEVGGNADSPAQQVRRQLSRLRFEKGIEKE